MFPHLSVAGYVVKAYSSRFPYIDETCCCDFLMDCTSVYKEEVFRTIVRRLSLVVAGEALD